MDEGNQSGRAADGKFGEGNTFGRGRPRRAVEREYLAVLGDAVSLADWREVAGRALAQAKAGDAKARDWLASYLLRNAPLLLDVAAAEHVGEPADTDIDNASRRRERPDPLAGEYEGVYGAISNKRMAEMCREWLAKHEWTAKPDRSEGG
jgi:hypothetical protein